LQNMHAQRKKQKRDANKKNCISLYVVQKIIACIGRVVTLLRTRVDRWSHEMVPSQQEAVACLLCIPKDSDCCEGQLSASGGNRECRRLRNEDMSGIMQIR
jgi:hypothetical protein